tara:strand:+ start:3156 stop:3395 length:240 start_codon:yes stop_codon:yes gene_type:complete
MRTTTLIIKTDHTTLGQLTDVYSDYGYTNIHGNDIIIDLDYIEDDPDQFAHFSEITGLTRQCVEGVSFICFYPPGNLTN